MIALSLLFIFTNNVAVHGQSPCSISEVKFYPRTAYAGQTTNIISKVIFICGPSYNNVWQVRVDLHNSVNNIKTTSSVQYVYASYANTAINVTDTFTAPQKAGVLILGVNAYIIEQYSGKIFASWSSMLTIQVQQGTVTYTTTTSTSVPRTTLQPSTTVTLTTNSTIAGGFSLSVNQLYLILAVVFSLLFVVVVAVRLNQRLRKKTQADLNTYRRGPT